MEGGARAGPLEGQQARVRQHGRALGMADDARRGARVPGWSISTGSASRPLTTHGQYFEPAARAMSVRAAGTDRRSR